MANKLDHDRDLPIHPERPVRPEAILAAQVLRTAMIDALGGPPELAADARAFLDGGEGLTFWSHVAGLDPQVVRTLAARTLAEGPGPTRWIGEPWRLSGLGRS